MDPEEFTRAVAALGMSLTDMAEDINRLSGAKMTGSDLSKMKKGAADGGRDPSHAVAIYLRLKLEQKRKDETDLARAFETALEKAGLRLVRAGAPPIYMTKDRE